MRDTSNNEAARPRCRLVSSLLRSRAALLLAITQLWQPLSTRAEPELSLSWSTPGASASCPDQAWVEARIAAQLGRVPKPEVARGVSASAAIATTPNGYALSLQTTFHGETGSRTLEGARCDELSEAAILIISLSVSEASEQIAQAPAPVPAAAAAEPGQTRAPPEPKPSGSGAALGGFVRADAVLQLGLWNRVAFGPGLALGLDRGLFRIEIGGIWYPPLTLQEQGREFEATLGAARALGCVLFGKARVRGGGCLGVEFGGARTESAQPGTKAHTWWGAFPIGGRLHVQLIAGLSLVASADLLLSLTRLRFSSEDEATRQTTPLGESKFLQLRASLGPELRF